ncbi:glucosamine-6-phosphate deaminase [Sulfobacillus thermosulfidooxidans DSM 9293]|uniref:Glucosamine-6-phosphate deaminase n=1 Tax=Sulfobacillus thermosulfidooxidans (strain DSM 9293 / VKM B-1269 / AT-1) TaxID=929705 RepID=A0A1W1WDW6_SULTA|nr:glucosamine-6-phosphate deaminase [Sulfobacillus thermosulfidooxidans]SMC04466.1 glucosamine-6-phosphate deaminase [Sulfobacillus thermosulfidooxidans DSM 9293]
MHIEVFGDQKRASQRIVDLLTRQLRAYPYSVLGLATGATVIPIYREIIGRIRREQLSLAQVRTFNLDEYMGLQDHDPHSFHAFMQHHLFYPAHLTPNQTFFPFPEFSQDPSGYDRLIEQHGGIDWQLLGIGHNGHIGFNEPGTSFDSETHVVKLTENTRKANRHWFDGDWHHVPEQALTMGLKTIMRSRTIVLAAFGASKSAVLAKAVYGPVCPELPASILQHHPRVYIICDQEAGRLLRPSSSFNSPGFPSQFDV